MPAFLNPIAARLAILALTTVAGAVVPAITMERPVLKWAAGRFGPAIVDAAEDRINDHFDVRPQPQPQPQPAPKVVQTPVRYDDGIDLSAEAVVDIGDPEPHYNPSPRRFPRLFQNRR